MKMMLRLARVIIRGNGFGSLAGDGNRKRRRLSGVGAVILFAFMILYLTALVSISAYALIELLAPFGLQSLVLGLYVSAGVMLSFFIGAMYVISLFYYTSDVDMLLPLPLRAAQIIGAKFLVTALYEYVFLAVLVLPPLVIYGLAGRASFVYYPAALLVFFLLPLIPLALATILTMLVMRFTPLARNKDRFNMVASLLLMLLSLAFVMASQTLANRPGADLALFFQQNADKVASLTTAVFPGTGLAIQGLVAAAPGAVAFSVAAPGTALLNLLGLLLLSGVALGLMMLSGQLLYFRGVIGLGAANSHRRRLRAAELRPAGHLRGAFWRFVRKDVQVLVRTPVFFLNNVLMNFLWPVFLILPVLSGSSGNDGLSLSQLQALLAQPGLQPADHATAVILAAIFAMACFVSGTNGITASALSREGRQFYIMKMIPQAYSRQLLAKVTVGILMSAAGLLLSFGVLIGLLQPPLWLVGLAVLVAPGAILIPNLAGIVFDLYWPKLNWENEQKAVKQNLNVLYEMAVALLAAGLVLAPTIAWQLSLPLTLLLLVALPLVLAAGLVWLIIRIGSRRMLAID